MQGSGMYHEMKVYGVAMDGVAQLPIIILKDAEDRHAMPVWLQAHEVLALAADLVPRVNGPSTDLLTTVLGKMGMTLERLTVDGLRETTFDVHAHFNGHNGASSVTVSMAEALGLSLRLHMPLSVADDVLERSASYDGTQVLTSDEMEAGRFAGLLERLKPSDLGKYPM